MVHLAVYSTGLMVDDQDWTSTDKRILARITEGLYDNFEVRGRDTVVPSLAGQIPRTRVADSRLIKAEGLVIGVGADEAAQRADFLFTRQTMASKMEGTQDPYNLVATLEDGSTATILARPLRIEWSEERIPTYREFMAFWLAVGDPEGMTTSPDWTLSGLGS